MAQGDRPTGGWLLSGIGAVTLIGNYRATGMAAIIVGLGVVGWTFLCVHRRWGPIVFLAASLVLVLVGGGVAIVPVSLVAAIVATRIHSPLTWWSSVLAARIRLRLSAAWLPTLVSGLALLLVGIAYWLIALPPGPVRVVGSPEVLLWSVLGTGLALMLLALVCGFARDIELGT